MNMKQADRITALDKLLGASRLTATFAVAVADSRPYACGWCL